MGSGSERRREGRGKPLRVLPSAFSGHQERLIHAQNAFQKEEALTILFTLVACTCQGADWTAKASDKTYRQESRETCTHVRSSLSVSLSFHTTAAEIRDGTQSTKS